MRQRVVVTFTIAVHIAACEAGASIKPGVKRGFVSETPGQDEQRISAREAGGRHVSLIAIARVAGQDTSFGLLLGLSAVRRSRLQPPALLSDIAIIIDR